ncbi:hypothetical protein [Angustibacter luteus]|uniref:DUF2188 domain-containing protein n=1 Tax=Angustibacter luteus TaxID=658456 RepID=A0ABW1JBV4_9ACTN
MSETWTWRYVDADGATFVPDGSPSTGFPTQSDAESWLGEEWRTLLDAGVDAVHLQQGEQEIYGPMSLRPAQ